ncbi:MAG: hypothetical protein V5783_09010 [Pontiella sp.]
MANAMLCVFEGARTEKQIFENIKKTFFRDSSVICTVYYGTDIYQLWKELEEDEFLDLTEVLRERNPNNEQALAERTRDDFSEVHLFFDYDGHATLANDEIISKMLALFNNETEHGKLYVSYPMIEAIKDIPANFISHTVPAKQNIHYKKILEKSPYQNLRLLSHAQWKKIIEANLEKAIAITSDDRPTQASIFTKQKEDYIDPKGEVSVLSGIPFFIIDYFEDYTQHLSSQETP